MTANELVREILQFKHLNSQVRIQAMDGQGKVRYLNCPGVVGVIENEKGELELWIGGEE